MAEKKKSRHELGPVTKEEVKKAGGSLKEVYRKRAEAGDKGAVETMKRVGRSELEARKKKDTTSIFHHRTKVVNQVFNQ